MLSPYTKGKGMEDGTAFIETIWFSYANRIVDLAAKTYSLDAEQLDLLRSKIKRGDLDVKPRGLHGSERSLILDGHVIEAWGGWIALWKESIRLALRKRASSTQVRLQAFAQKHL